MSEDVYSVPFQRELFLSEANNRKTIAVIEANNGMFCLQKRIEKFSLSTIILQINLAATFINSPRVRENQTLRDPPSRNKVGQWHLEVLFSWTMTAMHQCIHKYVFLNMDVINISTWGKVWILFPTKIKEFEGHIVNQRLF